jgi:hypothetical protein
MLVGAWRIVPNHHSDISGGFGGSLVGGMGTLWISPIERLRKKKHVAILKVIL